MTNMNAVIPTLMHLFIFFLLKKNVLFAQSDMCCELRETKCQPMRRNISQNNTVAIFLSYPIRRRVTYASALEYDLAAGSPGI